MLKGFGCWKDAEIVREDTLGFNIGSVKLRRNSSYWQQKRENASHTVKPLGKGPLGKGLLGNGELGGNSGKTDLNLKEIIFTVAFLILGFKFRSKHGANFFASKFFFFEIKVCFSHLESSRDCQFSPMRLALHNQLRKFARLSIFPDALSTSQSTGIRHGRKPTKWRKANRTGKQ